MCQNGAHRPYVEWAATRKLRKPWSYCTAIQARQKIGSIPCRTLVCIGVIAPDMPGYGKADRPESFDYTVEGYARHLTGILEQLGVKRAHLVLHDFGGPWFSAGG